MWPFRAGMFLNLRWHRLHSTGFWSALETAAVVVAAVFAGEAADDGVGAGVVVGGGGWALLATLVGSTGGTLGVGAGAEAWVVGVLDVGLGVLDVVVVVVVTLFWLSWSCMFHVRGRSGIFWPAAAAAATAALACFVCCMICVIRSSCCRVRPSLPVPVPAGDKLGEGVLEPPESTPPPLGVAVTWCC
uniref:(northern house mosquito) hypothetical protein n=1 Tax=Culex pipiens TaxID=7175 RepID=A0A8D8JRT3_CULPI